MKRKLSEVCKFQYGFPFDSSLFSDTNGTPVIRIRDIVRGFSETKTTETCSTDYIVDNDDILIGMDGEFNIAKWKGGKAFLNQRVCKLIPFDVNKDYIFYHLPKILKSIEEKTSFATVKHLSAKQLNSIYIDIPEQTIQYKIANVFINIDSLINKRKQQLSKLDQLVKSRFIEMFGECKTNPKNWKLLNMEEIADVGSSKRVFVEELQEEGIPFYRGTEVGTLAEGKSIEPELYITEEHYKELVKATGIPQLGDLLMPSICPDGRIWVVNTENPFYFKDGRVLWIHNIDTKFNSTFLLYSLKDRIMTDYLSIASGTTFAELKIFTLKKCKIFSVPLPLQEQFAAFVQQVDKVKSSIKQSLEKLETLKKSLMQKYFG